MQSERKTTGDISLKATPFHVTCDEITSQGQFDRASRQIRFCIKHTANNDTVGSQL